jgi:prepilin-type N-terminal cleavage/methylation domain-containing protein
MALKKIKTLSLSKGFSLIELIVVIGLLSMLMLAISSTMLMSIISSNRIRTTTKVKQAGGYAIGQIQSMVRSAKSIVVCDTSTPSATFIGQDGGSTEVLIENDGTNVRIASNSGVYLTPANMGVTSFAITCEPTEAEPTLIKFAFDLQDTRQTSGSQNPLLHFETSVSVRN